MKKKQIKSKTINAKEGKKKITYTQYVSINYHTKCTNKQKI